MKYLGVDIGKKRTGLAFGDSEDDIVFSLETLKHASSQDLIKGLLSIIEEKKIDMVIVGNPLLPFGEPGEQAAYVQEVAAMLKDHQISLKLVDERYTSQKNADFDNDAAAACELLHIELSGK